MRRFTPASRRSVNSIADLADRRLVARGVGLLAADMERQAVRVEPELAGAQHQLARAFSTVVPNLRDSGQSAPAFSTRMRQ